ncbi:MAG: Selenide,water dikinase [uncultured Segetibacter sp.]|uniref:Selenide, water dikinase n=1 Tax=uncultured Segetibacter sp. TaxID=481133 RepID=A0A6J4U0P7_9BACT|nr:MAG: Selenide,water dikinase [uncultured Segetibacter sp.]
MNSTDIKLTQYSHGAGCGCKIAPKVLDQILQSNFALPDNNRLLVGNHSKDDAAVYNMGNGTALISTTDFFMPIVDDPYQFGRIASANAISDVYAMGGKPIVAIAILGWPINKLSPGIAGRVIEGSRSICMEAGIPLAGGHSIDSPEPIFGLAVNGIVDIKNIKQNNTAKPGNVLFLTKKIGVGILTTAEKKGILKEEHISLAAKQMEQLNKAGEALGNIPGVTAMTDVTGFGLLGHLTEMCEGSEVSAELWLNKVPLLTDLKMYIDLKSIPGGTNRNWDSYGDKISFAENMDNGYATALLADPQTSGGLLIAADESAADEVQHLLQSCGLYDIQIGKITAKRAELIRVI